MNEARKAAQWLAGNQPGTPIPDWVDLVVNATDSDDTSFRDSMTKLEHRATELIKTMSNHHDICDQLSEEFGLWDRAGLFPIWLSRVVAGIINDQIEAEIEDNAPEGMEWTTAGTGKGQDIEALKVGAHIGEPVLRPKKRQEPKTTMNYAEINEQLAGIEKDSRNGAIGEAERRLMIRDLQINAYLAEVKNINLDGETLPQELFDKFINTVWADNTHGRVKEEANAKMYRATVQGRHFEVWISDEASYIIIEYTPYAGGDVENGPTTEYKSVLSGSGIGGICGREGVLDILREHIARETDTE